LQKTSQAQSWYDIQGNWKNNLKFGDSEKLLQGIYPCGNHNNQLRAVQIAIKSQTCDMNNNRLPHERRAKETLFADAFL
jgi:hypothetical protein